MVAEHAAGLRRDGDEFELFVPSRLGTEPAALARGGLVRLGQISPGLRGVEFHYWNAFDLPRLDWPRLDLAFYGEPGCSAAWIQDGRAYPLDDIRIVGPRMEVWRPACPPPALHGEIPEDGPYSRYIGAIGGAAVHERLRALRVTLVASSRLGSLLATQLARAGVRDLTLIDPDRLDAHSLDAVDTFADALGQPKVEAVAQYLARCAPATQLRCIVGDVASEPGLAAAAASDVIVSAPDDDRGRFVASLIATAYHRVLLDVGTGVRRERAQNQAGADLRLVLPGQGCLLCVGGLAFRRQDVDWRRNRAGSLRSLNSLATGQAMLLFERLVMGDLDRTTWLRVEVDVRGVAAVHEPEWTVDPECPICARAGLGDAAFLADEIPGGR